MARTYGGTRRWTHGVPVWERGPGETYRPDDPPPSLRGARQPGITTPLLDHAVMAALDLTIDGAPALSELLAALSSEAEQLMRARHRPPGGDGPAGTLTITLGLGPGVFGDRFGLAGRRPAGLAELPGFAGDAIDAATSGGDLGIQVCAADPGDASAALERLQHAAGGAAGLRWSQAAALHRAPGDFPGSSPRNLIGFKDATGNPRRGKDLDRHVWVRGRDRSWMLDGTYLVVRRVRILLDAWEGLSLDEQERVIGRHRSTGAPLGKTKEFDIIRDEDEAIPADAHARVAAPHANGGLTLLRRGYSFDNGPEASGTRDAGLLLLLYQRDPRRQFVPLQRRLDRDDALTHYTRTVGSAVFAVPPGRSLADGSLGSR